MTRISKQALDPAQRDALFLQMYTTLSRLTKTTTPIFFDQLLGNEEKLMFAKRLAGIVMCIEGNSSYRIWNVLKISPSTAGHIQQNYERGAYSDIEKIITQRRRDYKQFCHVLEVILTAGMPPRGRGRWKKTIQLMNQP